MHSQLIDTACSLFPLVLAAAGAMREDTDTSSALAWIAGLAAAAVIFNQVSSAWSRLTGRFTRDPASTQYQTTGRCEKMHERVEEAIDAMGDRISEQLKEMARDHEDRASKLHARIDPIGNMTVAVHTSLENHLADHRAGRTT